MPQIIFSQKGEILFQFPLRQKTTRIGRSEECDITLSGESISRIHLILYESEKSYLAKNEGKTGFRHNGESKENVALRDGDKISFENWEILFTETEEVSSKEEETYLSRVGSGETKILHSSLIGKELHSERLQLKILEPQKAPRLYPIHQEVTTIGKSRSADLMIADPSCSEIHCKLLVKQNRIQILDLLSTNGVYVNRVKVKEAELEEGFEVRLGETKFTLEFVSENKKIAPIEVDSFGPLIGKSPAMRELYGLIEQVAPTDATVCVLGETGAGKELVARALHDFSPRHLKSFVAINCGAISKELIESELFGHEKGAFTGAHQQRKGVFEQADGGTLFLDEMGELPLDLQSALLRVLETGKLRRVGGNQEISVDVRIICATHRDLSKQVQEGKFREDLFFRLFVFPVFLPPLRERREDVLLLAEHFLKMMTPPSKKIVLNPETIRYLESQDWKGNVRELKNSIQRAVVLSRSGEVEVDHLRLPQYSKVAVQDLEPILSVNTLQEIEKQAILRELRVQGDNRLATAKALGIAKSTLYEKLKQYGIS